MSATELWAPGGLFDRLRHDAAGDWARYVEHGFVRQLGRGTLKEKSFRHYLGHDYLFLIHFARAYALAVYKGTSLAEMRQAARGLKTILDVEMGLHVKYCAGWGLSRADMEALPEDGPTLAYTRYVLETGMAGDLLDLSVALAPCIVGYADIADRLTRDPATRHDGNPYAEGIAMYASPEYRAAARDAADHLDVLWRTRAGGGRYERLLKIFREATRLEADFWQMGLDAGA